MSIKEWLMDNPPPDYVVIEDNRRLMCGLPKTPLLRSNSGNLDLAREIKRKKNPKKIKSAAKYAYYIDGELYPDLAIEGVADKIGYSASGLCIQLNKNDNKCTWKGHVVTRVKKVISEEETEKRLRKKCKGYMLGEKQYFESIAECARAFDISYGKTHHALERGSLFGKDFRLATKAEFNKYNYRGTKEK